MAITVDWNGSETPITSSNAYAIYQDYLEGDIDDMSSAAINACKNYLSDEEVEEIEENYYNSEEGGASSIDTDGIDGNNGVATAGTTGGVAAVTGGTIMGILANEKNTAQEGQASNAVNGFGALLVSGLIMAGAALALASVWTFDQELPNRKSKSEESDSSDATIDDHSAQLIDSQDAMNDDMDAYAATSEEYTLAVNENTSNKANLEAQLKACQASGDTAGAESIQSQLESLEEESEETTTEGMDEIQENMSDYQDLASRSIGVRESGYTVSDYLKPGRALGIVAKTCAVLAGLCGVYIGALAAVGAIPKMAPFFPDTPASTASRIMYGLAALALGTCSYKLFDGAKDELECGENGRDMEGRVNTLNEEIESQSEYMDFTNETYGEVDEASAESQEKASEAAGEVLANNGITTTDDGSNRNRKNTNTTARQSS